MAAADGRSLGTRLEIASPWRRWACCVGCDPAVARKKTCKSFFFFTFETKANSKTIYTLM